MGILSFLWNTFLYRPIFNLLALFYITIAHQDFGVSLILVTILIKLLTFSFTAKARQQQVKTQELGKEINDLKLKFSHDKELLGKKIAETYKKHNYNPFGSCLVMIVQIFVFAALWRVIRGSIGDNFEADHLYSFVFNIGNWPHSLNTMFLGKLDLMQKTSSSIFGFVLLAISSVSQFITISLSGQKVAKPSEGSSDQEQMSYQIQRQSRFMTPLFSLFLLSFPLGLSLYSATSSILTLLQFIILKYTAKVNGGKNKKG